MQIIDIAPRRRGLAAVTLLPAPALGIEGAEYEKDKLLIDREILARCAIEKGMVLNSDELKKLVYVSECYRAKQRAVWHLSQSDHSEKSLYDKLCRSFTGKAAAFAVGQMVEKGYLNDAGYASRLVGQLSSKNLSKRAIQNKLIQKGISAEVSKQAVQSAGLSCSDADRAFSLIRSKYINKITDEEGLRKTVLALQRRGFSFSDIKTALARLKTDLCEGEEID